MQSTSPNKGVATVLKIKTVATRLGGAIYRFKKFSNVVVLKMAL